MHSIWNQVERHINLKFALCKVAFSRFEMKLRGNLKLASNLEFILRFTHGLPRRYMLFISAAQCSIIIRWLSCLGYS